jgi:hypothetical protein
LGWSNQGASANGWAASVIDLCVGKYYALQDHKAYTPNKCIHVLGPRHLNGVTGEVRVIALEGCDLDLLAYVDLAAEQINKKFKDGK